MKTIFNKRGVALIMSLVLTVALAIIGAAFFSTAVNENLLTQREQDHLRARYWADMALACLRTELTYHNTSWATHQAATRLQPPLPLEKITAPPVEIALPLTCRIDAASGDYIYDEDNDGTPEFAIKIYQDPTVSEGVARIALIRATSGSATRLFAVKIPSRKLYEFFVFSPFSQSFRWATWEAGGGKIYVGGDVIFDFGGALKDVSSLETPGAVRFTRQSFIPANVGGEDGDYTDPGDINWDALMSLWRPPYSGYRTNPADYYTHPTKGLLYVKYWNAFDGAVGGDNYYKSAGDTASLLMFTDETHTTTTYWDGTQGHPPLLPDEYPDKYYKGWATFLNTVKIPNRNQAVPWDWDKYYLPRQYQPTLTNSLHPLPGANMSTTHVNSIKYTLQQWHDFLHDLGPSKVLDQDVYLDQVIKEKNTGGRSITPLTITAQAYKADAQSSGIFVTDIDDETNVCFAGDCHTFVGGKITIGGKDIAEEKTFYNTTSATEVHSVKLDAGELTAGQLGNGIVWSDKDIVVTNGSALNGKMTIVSPEHIYIHGSFNNEGVWKPAAAISAKNIFILSRDFTFPTELPDSIYPPNYPYCPSGVDTRRTCTSDDLSDWATQHADTLPNKVINEADPHNGNEYYDLSFIGYYGSAPAQLERWRDANTFFTTANMQGAFVRLPPGTFPAVGALQGTFMPRCCAGTQPLGFPTFPAGHCRDCAAYGTNSTYNMYTQSAGSKLAYETRYTSQTEDATCAGTLAGFTEALWLEIANTTQNFNNHYVPFSTADYVYEPVCPDTTCNYGENCYTCAADCGPCICGNTNCEPGETCRTCRECCTCKPDGNCTENEDCYSCPGDCSCPCGDGRCDLGETCATCSRDCRDKCFCGDGFCDEEEQKAGNCPQDCNFICGNGKCESGETWEKCPADCREGCGDGTCSGGGAKAAPPQPEAETCETCPTDCGACSVCNENGRCEPEIGEDLKCTKDCQCKVDGECHPPDEVPGLCSDCVACNDNKACEPEKGENLTCINDCRCDGNGECQGPMEVAGLCPDCNEIQCNNDKKCDYPTEDLSCVNDCICVVNGYCEPTDMEIPELCPQDCASSCNNDEYCTAGETCASCPDDCGDCNGEYCGNGKCKEGVEDCKHCERDCGVCPG